MDRFPLQSEVRTGPMTMIPLGESVRSIPQAKYLNNYAESWDQDMVSAPNDDSIDAGNISRKHGEFMSKMQGYHESYGTIGNLVGWRRFSANLPKESKSTWKPTVPQYHITKSLC